VGRLIEDKKRPAGMRNPGPKRGHVHLTLKISNRDLFQLPHNPSPLKLIGMIEGILLLDLTSNTIQVCSRVIESRNVLNLFDLLKFDSPGFPVFRGGLQPYCYVQFTKKSSSLAHRSFCFDFFLAESHGCTKHATLYRLLLSSAPLQLRRQE